MFLDWTTLRPGDLPAPLDEIGTHGGDEVAERLEALGAPALPDGVRERLGMAVAWALAETLGGTVVYVSGLAQLERDARDAAIYAAHDGGAVGLGKLARKFSVSRRTVKKAIQSFAPAAPEPAPSRRSRQVPPPGPSLFDPAP